MDWRREAGTPRSMRLEADRRALSMLTDVPLTEAQRLCLFGIPRSLSAGRVVVAEASAARSAISESE